jgi:hypothetical protein
MKALSEFDATNNRTQVMWDECGIRFRSNLCNPGGGIPLHKHSYPHVAIVHGNFMLTTISPEGEEVTRKASNKEFVPAGWEHKFSFMDDAGVGEVLCIWPIGSDGAA